MLPALSFLFLTYGFKIDRVVKEIVVFVTDAVVVWLACCCCCCCCCYFCCFSFLAVGAPVAGGEVVAAVVG